MRPQSKAYAYTFAATATLISMELGVIKLWELSDSNLFIFVFAPLVLLSIVLFWLHKITGIKCNHCNNLYGVTVGLGGWADVPSACINCGKKENAL